MALAPARSTASGAFLIGARGSILVLQAGVSAVIGRLLAPDKYGVYAAGASIILVTTALGAFGLDQLLLNGKLTEREFRNSTKAAAVVAVVASWIAVALWPNLTGSSRLVGLSLALGAGLTLWRMPWIVIPGTRLEFGVRARRELGAALLAAVAAIVLAAMSGSPVITAFGAVVANVIIFAVPSTRRRSHGWRLGSSLADLRKGLPFAISGALYSLYFAVDGALLAAFRPPRQVGFYRIATSLMLAAVTVAVVVNNDIMRAHLLNAKRGSDKSRRFLAGDVVLGLAAAGTMYFLGPVVVRLFYGNAFNSAATLVRILALAIPVYFVNSWLANVLVFRDRIRTVLCVQALLLVGNVTANFYLIPARGAQGAAIVTVGTEATCLLLYVISMLVLPKRRAAAVSGMSPAPPATSTPV